MWNKTVGKGIYLFLSIKQIGNYFLSVANKKRVALLQHANR